MEVPHKRFEAPSVLTVSPKQLARRTGTFSVFSLACSACIGFRRGERRSRLEQAPIYSNAHRTNLGGSTPVRFHGHNILQEAREVDCSPMRELIDRLHTLTT